MRLLLRAAALGATACLSLLCLPAISEPAGDTPRSLAAEISRMGTTGDWPYYGGNKGFQRYTPLDEINAGNVGKLKILWRRPGVDASLTQRFPDLSPSH